MPRIANDAKLGAAEERIRRRDYRGALNIVQRVLSSDQGLTDNEKTEWDLLTAECLAFLGKHHEAVALSSALAAKLRRDGDHALYARASFSLSIAKEYLGDIDEATECMNLALFSFKRAEDRGGAARALNALGNIALNKSDYSRALSSYSECIRMAQEYGMARWIPVAGDNMGRVYLLLGKLREAHVAFRGNRKRLVQLGERLNILRHDLSHAYLEILQRRFARAEAILRRIKDDAAPSSVGTERGIWQEYMGELEYWRGNLAQAQAILKEAITMGLEEGPDPMLLSQSRRLLAEVHLARGDLDAAVAECEQALVSIRKVGERIEEGAVLRVMASVHAARGQRDDAARAFRQSAEILMQIGARLEWAKTGLAAGRSNVLSEQERLGFLFEAERRFTEIGVEYWIKETRAAIEAVLSERGEPQPDAPVTRDHKEAEPVLITEHDGTLTMLEMAARWALQDLAILITGETGTGKDLLARKVHWMSPRRHRPFVTVDLNVLPETLWQSELFGHRKGAFTGAANAKLGLLETANGGTVFLNEVGNLPLELQSKLLELLDTRQIRRLGDLEPTTLDIRFIAATNADLREAVNSGQFRADLYYRLEQAPLHLLPLRERRDDIPLLIRHFLTECDVRPALADDVLSQPWVPRAMKLPWPGNVRELRHFTVRLAGLAGSKSPQSEFELWAERLVAYMEGGNGRREFGDGPDAERRRLLDMLHHCGWNQRAAARQLRMSEGGLRHQMKRLGIHRPE
jgi:DNA-binding NtrC family response regulator